MRVFLDTNVLAAAFATRGLCADVLRAVLTQHELVLTRPVLIELERFLRRKLRLDAGRVTRVMSFLREHEVVFEPAPEAAAGLVLCDPTDLPIVASALAAGAEVIVTGDRELVAATLPIPVETPREFWERLRGRPADAVHEP